VRVFRQHRHGGVADLTAQRRHLLPVRQPGDELLEVLAHAISMSLCCNLFPCCFNGLRFLPAIPCDKDVTRILGGGPSWPQTGRPSELKANAAFSAKSNSAQVTLMPPSSRQRVKTSMRLEHVVHGLRHFVILRDRVSSDTESVAIHLLCAT
jgi:hypothetical protein